MLSAAYCVAGTLNSKNSFVDDTLYSKEICEAARRHGVDPLLVRAVVYQESRFKADAVGSDGEVGLMQVLPAGAVADWARWHKRKAPSHADLMDVEVNLEIGVWYLARALKRWQDHKEKIPLALIQYNAGESRAVQWKPQNPTAEVIPGITILSTRRYVTGIMERYSRYLKEK